MWPTVYTSESHSRLQNLPTAYKQTKQTYIALGLGPFPRTQRTVIDNPTDTATILSAGFYLMSSSHTGVSGLNRRLRQATLNSTDGYANGGIPGTAL